MHASRLTYELQLRSVVDVTHSSNSSSSSTVVAAFARAASAMSVLLALRSPLFCSLVEFECESMQPT
jgi:hypothetical protein